MNNLLATDCTVLRSKLARSNNKTNKGFSNRNIKILSMNKTQKYLRYWVQIYCGCSASITFYE